MGISTAPRQLELAILRAMDGRQRLAAAEVDYVILRKPFQRHRPTPLRLSPLQRMIFDLAWYSYGLWSDFVDALFDELCAATTQEVAHAVITTALAAVPTTEEAQPIDERRRWFLRAAEIFLNPNSSEAEIGNRRFDIMVFGWFTIYARRSGQDPDTFARRGAIQTIDIEDVPWHNAIKPMLPCMQVLAGRYPSLTDATSPNTLDEFAAQGDSLIQAFLGMLPEDKRSAFATHTHVTSVQADDHTSMVTVRLSSGNGPHAIDVRAVAMQPSTETTIESFFYWNDRSRDDAFRRQLAMDLGAQVYPTWEMISVPEELL